MRIDFNGRLADEPEIRAGFIGCGSHSFRNLYPVFQFIPARLAAVCDLELPKAREFAARFGAQAAYADYREMLAKEKLDAVFVCTGYDRETRQPTYPSIVKTIVEAGCHVWIEKPPAATCRQVRLMQEAAAKAKRVVMVGFKKMFFPANEKAKELMTLPEFGRPALATLQYTQAVPLAEHLREYLDGRSTEPGVVSFLDHLCHPISLMTYLFGMPRSLYYERAFSGAASATFGWESGLVANLTLAHSAGHDGGIERTQIISDSGRTILVENNIRVRLVRKIPYRPGTGYGRAPDYFAGGPNEASASWEPEFSLGQLYNKGLFLLGYWGEMNEFCRCILDKRPPAKGTLEDAMAVTRIFEAFAEGPGKVIGLC